MDRERDREYDRPCPIPVVPSGGNRVNRSLSTLVRLLAPSLAAILILAIFLPGCADDTPTGLEDRIPLHLYVTFAPEDASAALDPAGTGHGIERMRALAYGISGSSRVLVDADSVEIAPEDTSFRLALQVSSGARLEIYVLADGTLGTPPNESEFGTTWFGAVTVESAQSRTLRMTLTRAVPIPKQERTDRVTWDPVTHAIGYEVWETAPEQSVRIVETNGTEVEIDPGIDALAGGDAPEDHYVYRLRSLFPEGFVSALSETLRVTNLRPSQVRDLRVAGTGFDDALLTWTAPGADGSRGTATEYDLRQAEFPIRSGFDFGRATRIPGPPPEPAGEAQTFRVGSLEPTTTYFFAVVAIDEWGNRGGISNTVEVLTGADPSGACCFPDGHCEALLPLVCQSREGDFLGSGTPCEPNPCPDPVEACCFDDGRCEVSTAESCGNDGGIHQGTGSVCDPNPCPQPPREEACCFGDGSCSMLLASACLDAGGVGQGPETPCDPNPCPQPAREACCVADGSCSMQTVPDCVAAGGLAAGPDTVCDPNPCPQPEGACCFPDGSCTLDTELSCENSGGTSLGIGTLCDPNPCPQPEGACCLEDGSCLVATEAGCIGQSGVYEGDDSGCEPNPCPPPTGACCFQDGTCLDSTSDDCDRSGGSYEGDEAVCEPNPCPQPPPVSACCFGDGSCLQLAESDCLDAGGLFQQPETACDPNPCPQPPPTEACCFADGSCSILTAADCVSMGGTNWGADTPCEPNPCPEPVGACCHHDGSCTAVTETDCGAEEGSYLGDETECDPNPCPQPTGACCLELGACAELTESDCTASEGAYEGDETVCDPNPCPQPPDLRVAAIEWNLEDLDCGEVIRTRVQIENAGSGSAGAGAAEIRLDGLVVCGFATPALESLGSAWSEWCEVQLPSPGRHDLEARADVGNTTNESDEQNNSAQIEIETEGCVDLVIAGIELTPEFPDCGQGGEVRLRVENLGNVGSGQSLARIFVDGEFLARIGIGPVDPGVPVYSAIVPVGGFEDQVEVEACVDVDDTVPELDEENNCALATWTTGICSGWLPDFGPTGLGADGPVYALIEWGGRTIAAGRFQYIGGVLANSIAEFDGSGWHALGGGVKLGGNLGTVWALTVFDGDLIVAGSFDSAGGLSIANVARWNGSAWSGYSQQGTVRSLAVFNQDLIAGGDFSGHIARWNGEGWSTLGGGSNESGVSVFALEVFNGSLYAGGNFLYMGTYTGNVGRWDGSYWSGRGYDLDGTVLTLNAYQGSLLAGGLFSIAYEGGENLAVWAGEGWLEFEGGANGQVRSLETRSTTLYATGGFSQLGNVGANGVGAFNGSTWSRFGTGLSVPNQSGYAILPVGGGFFVGGSFDRAGGVPSSYIGFWRY